MLHRNFLRNFALLAVVLVLTAACTAALQDVAAPESAPAQTLLLPTPTPAPVADLLPTPTPVPTPVPAPALTAGELAALKVELAPVAENLSQPLFVTHAGDGSGRLFIVEKTGTIRMMQDGALLPAPFLDISSQVSGGSEQGLLGLAFPPDFAATGYFFVNYTDTQGATQVARFQTSAEDPNRADPDSEFTVLTLSQPARNHNGGMLAFGPDGMLYIGTGDGGGANDTFGNGQNPATLLGKMLRLDVTSAPEQPYVVPPDNPWVDVDWNGVDVRDEIWAVGLRNPWRYSFDRASGDLWVADVGQNQWEEVNFAPATAAGGLNYGWPIMESNHCFQAAGCDRTGLTLPIAEYQHVGHCSVTGGYVYRGQVQPGWQGVYFYGDYCSGTLWALAPDGSGGWANAEIARTGLTLSSFGEDEAGELYVTDLSGGGVYRLEADTP